MMMGLMNDTCEWDEILLLDIQFRNIAIILAQLNYKSKVFSLFCIGGNRPHQQRKSIMITQFTGKGSPSSTEEEVDARYKAHRSTHKRLCIQKVMPLAFHSRCESEVASCSLAIMGCCQLHRLVRLGPVEQMNYRLFNLSPVGRIIAHQSLDRLGTFHL